MPRSCCNVGGQGRPPTSAFGGVSVSAWEIPLAAVQSYGVTVAIILPVAITCIGAESLILPVLVPDPRRKRRSWQNRALALLAWVAAVTVSLSGCFLAFLLYLIAVDRTQVTLLALVIGCGFALGLQIVHVFMTVRAARLGAQLILNHAAWETRFKEARHIRRVLTFTMPLRAWDSFWPVVAGFLALLYPLAVFSRQQDGVAGPVPLTLQAALFGAFAVVLILSATLYLLFDRAMPQYALALWAGYQMARTRGTGGRRTKPLTAQVAPLLNVCIRRRARRIPPSLRDDFLATASKLAEVFRVAYIQQNTSQRAQRTMWDALQYGARLANSKDTSEAVRRVDAWLVSRGLDEISATPPRIRRPLPTLQWMSDLSNLVKNVKDLAVVLVLVALTIAAGAGLKDIFTQFK